jgi:hypothetical protein
MSVQFSDGWVSEAEIREMLRCSYDTLRQIAAMHGVGMYQLIALRDGRRPMIPAIAKHFGFEKATVYRRKEESHG